MSERKVWLDLEGNITESEEYYLPPDNNVPQWKLREKIANLQQDLGNVLNILHFLITDKTMPIPEELRSKLWPMMDALIKEQNER